MDERDFEMSERKTAMERDAQVGRASAAVSGTGTAHCIDCGYVIPEDRRKAAPFAKRCVECQGQTESNA